MTTLLWNIVKMLVATAMVCCSCSRSLVDGGVSETTNGVSASIVYQDGSPCVNGTVRLRSPEYTATLSSIPSKSTAGIIDSITDEHGDVFLQNLDSGSYIIEVNDQKGNALALKATIPGRGPVVKLGTQTILKTGSARGTVSHASRDKLFLQIRGLERIAAVDTADGSFGFDGIPGGVFGLHVASASPGIVSSDLDSLKVRPDDTAHLGALSLFRYNRRIIISTAASGAAVAENAVHFPLLVRLSTATFDFTQARPDGGDVRFFKSSGAPLPCEFERWDPVGGQAEIWVKLDTVFGNNDTQNILMMWGDPSASSPARLAGVFDTANGFQGVWHLGEPGDAFCLDATINQHNGTPYGMTPASSVAGAIGRCCRFDGASSYFQMHGSASGKLDFSQNGSYSLSAWVFVDTVDTGNQLIISKGNRQYFLKAIYSDSAGGYSWDFAEYEDRSGWQATSYSAQVKEWKYVVAVRNGARQYLYVDGVCVDSSIAGTPDTLPRETGNDLTIGRYIQAVAEGDADGFCYFKGMMDEVRVCNVPRSSSWIRLCYLNQKAIDALIHFH